MVQIKNNQFNKVSIRYQNYTFANEFIIYMYLRSNVIYLLYIIYVL